MYYNKGYLFTYRNESVDSFQMECIKAFTKAIDLAPDSAQYYTQRAEAYLNLRKLDSALKDFNQAIHLDPYTDHNYKRIHWIYFRARDETMKAKYLREGCFDTFANKYKRQFEPGDAYLRAGKCLDLLPNNYESEGYVKKVVDKFKKALEIDPDNLEYLEELGMKYSLHDSSEKVVPIINKLLEIKKRSLYYIHLASAQEVIKGKQKALEVYNEAIEEFPNQWQLYCNRSDLYDELGKNDLAKKDEKKYEKLIGR